MGFLDSLFKQVSNVFGGLGNAASGAMGAVTNAGANVGKGMMSQFTQPQKGGGGFGQAIGKGLAGAGSAALQGALSGNAGTKGYAPQIAKGGFNAMFQQPNFSQAQTPPTGGGFSSGVDTAPAQATQKPGFNFMDIFNNKGAQTGLGLASNLIGQFGVHNPKVPTDQINGLQSVQNLRNFNGQLPSNVEGLINRNVDEQQRVELKRLQDVYNNARPGTDYTTDSAYQRDLANLQRQQTLNRSDALAQAQLQFSGQEISRLSELAQYDITAIMDQTGLDYQEATSLKNMFGNIGDTLMSSGMGAFDSNEFNNTQNSDKKSLKERVGV